MEITEVPISRWINKEDVVYIVNEILVITKNEMVPFATTWLDVEIIVLNKKKIRKRNTIRYHIHVESKISHKWTYLWNRNRLTYIENRCVVAKGAGDGGGGGKYWEFGISRWKLLLIYREWINNKVLPYSTGTYIQYSVINHKGK